MLHKIDFWLLGKLEKFSHWFQRLTGKNCFWLARISAICYGLAGAVLLAHRAKDEWHIASFSVFIFFAVVFFLWLVRSREKIVEWRTGLSNPFKIIDRCVRIILLFLVPIFSFLKIIDTLNGKVSFLLISTCLFGNMIIWQELLYYFSACDPLPPAKSKLKAWKEKLAGAVKDIFSPAPQLQPQKA